MLSVLEVVDSVDCGMVSVNAVGEVDGWKVDVSKVVGTRDSGVEEKKDGVDTWLSVDVSVVEAELEVRSGVFEGVPDGEFADETPVPLIVCLRARSLFKAAQSKTVEEAHDAMSSKNSQKGPVLGNMFGQRSVSLQLTAADRFRGLRTLQPQNR